MVLTHYENNAGTIYPTVEDAKYAFLETIVTRGVLLKDKRKQKEETDIFLLFK